MRRPLFAIAPLALLLVLIAPGPATVAVPDLPSLTPLVEWFAAQLRSVLG